jgi:DNA-3-methyladenine glycosylase
MRVTRQFFHQPTLKAAKSLLGKFLVRKINGKIISGMIVETEAYVGFDDKASHASRGKTARNALMFGDGGFSYIYLIYGMYNCFNITTEKPDFPAAVLIRALEPVDGVDLMKKFRHTDVEKNLCAGPGKLCQALNLTKNQNELDLTKSKELWLEDRGVIVKPTQIVKTKRVGVDYAGDWAHKPWRFYIKGNNFISKK